MPSEDDKRVADVWKTVREAAIKGGVSIGEIAEAVRVLSWNGVSEDWRCGVCHGWNPRSRDSCFYCSKSSETQKGTGIRVIRFLKKLRTKDVC